MPMELWEAGPDHRVACIRSIRGEIPIPEYKIGAPSVVIARSDSVDAAAAIVDDLTLNLAGAG